MTPGNEILAQLEAAGVHLRAEGGNLVAGPKGAITDELRGLMRAHKAALLQALESAQAPATARRRQRVLAMLADRQAARYAVLTDAEADPDAVILALAIRGVGTCELRVPREKFDAFLLLDLIAKHGGMVH